MERIIICVEGGLVTGVYSSNPESKLDIHILDYDNYNSSHSYDDVKYYEDLEDEINENDYRSIY